MSTSAYIARQPILDTRRDTFAYELLYRDSQLSSEITNDRHATVKVLNNALNKFGVKNLLGEYKAFIKTDKKFLMHDVVFTIPKDNFIFAMQANMQIDDSMRDRISELHQKGYTLAINDTLINKEVLENFSEILQYVSYIKIDIKSEEKNLQLLKNYNIKTIFTKVESYKMYEKAKSLNCDYVQGYFFSKPKVLIQEKFDPSNLEVVQLCNLLMSDASINSIVAAFEGAHAISLQLLKFINSGYFSFRNHISSIRQILTLVGREPLTQWLMLIVYSSSFEHGSAESPLMTLVKSRTNLMVEVTKKIVKKDSQELASKAYFVGVISLMDTLFSVPIERILEELNVDDNIKEAILENKGILGEILTFAKSVENFNVEAIEEFSTKYNLKIEDLEKLTTEALRNANELEIKG